MNRRQLITIGPAALLAACSTTPAQAKTDADLINLGVQMFAPVLAKAIPSQARTITDAAAAIQAADTALGGVLDKTSSVSSVQTIVSDVQVLAPIAIKYLPAGSTEALAAEAAVALLPAVLAAAGVASGGVTVQVAMTPADARKRLRNL